MCRSERYVEVALSDAEEALEQTQPDVLQPGRYHVTSRAPWLRVGMVVGGLCVGGVVAAECGVRLARATGRLAAWRRSAPLTLVSTPAAFLTSGGPIRLAADPNMCLDVRQETTSDLQLWSCADGNNNQQFSIIPSSGIDIFGDTGHIEWMSNIKFPAQCLTIVSSEDAGNQATLTVKHCLQASSFTIPPGRTGLIRWQQNPEKCLRVPGNIQGVDVELRDCDVNDPLMTFNMDGIPSYVLGVIRWNDTLCISVEDGGSSVTLADCGASTRTQLLLPRGGHVALIRWAAHADQCLFWGPPPQGTQAGEPKLRFWNCVEGGAGEMLFEAPKIDAPSGAFRLPITNQCLSVEGDDPSDGSIVAVASCFGATAPMQMFRPVTTGVFDPLGVNQNVGGAQWPCGTHTIQQKNSSQLLDTDGNHIAVTHKHAFTSNDVTPSQLWIIAARGDGTYSIQQAATQLFLNGQASSAVVGEQEKGWLITPVGSLTEFAIREQESLRFLGGAKGIADDGFVFLEDNGDGSDSQRWIIGGSDGIDSTTV